METAVSCSLPTTTPCCCRWCGHAPVIIFDLAEISCRGGVEASRHISLFPRRPEGPGGVSLQRLICAKDRACRNTLILLRWVPVGPQQLPFPINSSCVNSTHTPLTAAGSPEDPGRYTRQSGLKMGHITGRVNPAQHKCVPRFLLSQIQYRLLQNKGCSPQMNQTVGVPVMWPAEACGQLTQEQCAF